MISPFDDSTKLGLEARTQATPIRWFNLPYWALRTAGADWRSHTSTRRTITARRIFLALSPNLARPIFLIGSPRSGTTFLGKCMTVLPEVSYHFEPIATKAAARYVYEGLWNTAKSMRFYRRVYAWLMRIHLDGDLIFAEKTPRNVFIVPFLLQCFPDARFIHIIRDGRDVALSLSKRPWLQAAQGDSGRREPGGYRYGAYAQFWVERERQVEFENTTDIHRCIWSWRRHTEAGLEHGAALPREQYHELRYETLVTQPRPTADAILNFLRIDSQRSRGLFQEAVAQAKTDSVGAWRHGLSDSSMSEIQQEAGPLLRKLAYQEGSGGGV